ncbi:aldehyde dehydrogenase family protein [Corynebacterium halotolerans]|uniref:aldehyde dehydrogenase family protein n=1 Tax=Corynebacterium halotolerans TaxID=225326 RepID=UPI003CE9E3E1
MQIAREMIFGPVTTILKYDDTHDANETLESADNTEFGLGRLVFGTEETAVLAVARQVGSNSGGTNFFSSNRSAPFGGRHDYSMGVEYGIEGLSAYLSHNPFTGERGSFRSFRWKRQPSPTLPGGSPRLLIRPLVD